MRDTVTYSNRTTILHQATLKVGSHGPCYDRPDRTRPDREAMGTVAPDEACSRPSDPSGVCKFKGAARRNTTVACAGASASVLTHSLYLRRRVRVHAHDGLDELFNIRDEAGTG
ncbi:jg17335 [Pararge aegeria aegeria]|uniref:Jg17335 protein n=1 Tax=Pararge aegeria aegeria TaxID=348720 RepID=A0A8S4SQI6_9NEOP|nr:jg17335 [Pararge aegeria aegeria]